MARMWRVGLAAIVVAAAMVASTGPAEAARDVSGTCPPVTSAPFPDVAADHVHAPGVVCVLHHGVTVGRSDGTYGSLQSVTRGQMASFLRRALSAVGSPVPSAVGPVPGDPHAANLHDLILANVIPAEPANSEPSGAISRSEMVEWMTGAHRFHWGHEPYAGVVIGQFPFSDVDPDVPWGEDLAQLEALGVVAGVGDGRFLPTASVSRGQMASFLARLVDLLLDGVDLPDFDDLSPAAQEVLRESADNINGTVHRWATSPIRFHAKDYWYPETVAEGVAFWNDLLGDLGIEVVVVDDPAEADIVFENVDQRPSDPTIPPYSCGSEGFDPDRDTESGRVFRGFGTYWLDSGDCGGGDHRGNTGSIGHGLGHVLGLMAHTPSGHDLMGSPLCCDPWDSELLTEIMRFMYSVPPGYRLPS